MVIEVEREAVISRPARELWQLVEDVRRIPQWLAFAERVEVVDGALRVGGRLRLHGRWRSRRSEIDVEVTAFEPGRLLAWRHLAERVNGKQAPRFARETRFEIRLSPEGAATSVRLRSEQEPAGPIRGFAVRLVGRRDVERRMELSLRRLEMIASILD